MTSTPLDRIAQLARIAEALERGEAPSGADAAWLSDGLRCYLQDAAAGVSLEDALGISPTAPGEEHWTTTQRRNRRNTVIRAIRARPLFSDMGLSSAAKEIAALGCRYRHAGRAKQLVAKEIDTATEELLREALCTGLPFPGARQIQSILEIK